MRDVKSWDEMIDAERREWRRRRDRTAAFVEDSRRAAEAKGEVVLPINAGGPEVKVLTITPNGVGFFKTVRNGRITKDGGSCIAPSDLRALRAFLNDAHERGLIGDDNF